MAHYCYVTVRELPPFFDHKLRVVYSRIEMVENSSQIEHPSVRACLDYFGIRDGLEIHHNGDLPHRSGIGSSSAFTVGLLQALHAINGRRISPDRLASEAIHVEQEVLGESVGIQDQIMAAHGGLRVITMGPGKIWTARPFVLPVDYLNALEAHVLLGFSGISRYAEEHARKQVTSIISGDNEAQLKEISALTEEAITTIGAQADFYQIGKLLKHAWNIKKRLAHGVSTEWIDEVYESAIAAGAYGGKLMGAGGGGFFMFLAPPHKHIHIKQTLKNIRVWVPFKLDTSGSQVVFQQS